MSLKLPSAIYDEKVQSGLVDDDSVQRKMMKHFDAVAKATAQSINPFAKLFTRAETNRCIYMWGSVGVGKTFMMDCFYQSISLKKKKRKHYHAFMQDIHARMNQYLGKADPVRLVVRDLSKQFDVICLDEFFVSDIADAMILGRLIKYLVDSMLTLVITSNVPPNQLYMHGLQRQNFIPAIKLLEKHFKVIGVDISHDYRMKFLRKKGVYYVPAGAMAREQMEKAFELYAGSKVNTKPLMVFGRKIPVVKSSEKIAWFDFNVICNVPRSSKDYIELSKRFDVVMIENIPVIEERKYDLITCFIHLVDVLYDTKTKVIISAAAKPEGLYPQGALGFEYVRTCSRLFEMQSEEYLKN